MNITFLEVQKYLASNKTMFKTAMQALEDFLTEGRDEENIPIYLTRCRLKSAESVYLKTKRKKITDLSSITDYVGIRVLCLYEKDIYDVHEFLLGLFSKKDYELDTVNIFNWDPHCADALEGPLTSTFPGTKGSRLKKKSGYKSIHYILCRRLGKNSQFFMEIQLRTLLQDVWGELEHALSYKKGEIHPHIKKSFLLLARDLETNDILMSHLRDISEKEISGENYSNDKAGPRVYFNYEPDLLPDVFSGALAKEYQKYTEVMNDINYQKRETRIESVKGALEQYNYILDNVPASALKGAKFRYWDEMERAFLAFCECKYFESLEIYNRLLPLYPKHYCIKFRIGEIYLIKGEVEKALAAFDDGELLIHETVDHVNHYRIKTMLALIYWMLGDEYIDIAVEKIDEAADLYYKYSEISSNNKEIVLYNNLTWYYLCKFINSRSEDAHEKAYVKYEKLISLVDENTGSNTFDTCAWFCYNTYLFTKKREFLDLAKNHCMRMGERVNYTSYNFRSMHTQMNHIQQIMSER